jgi:preprotein translocase subunit YajC
MFAAFLAAEGDPGLFATLIIPLGIMFLVMYVFMIRPQAKQARERDNILNQIKKDDHVMTSGGIFGIVDRVSDTEVSLKVDENKGVKIRVARSSIASVIKVSGGAAPEKKEEEKKS